MEVSPQDDEYGKQHQRSGRILLLLEVIPTQVAPGVPRQDPAILTPGGDSPGAESGQGDCTPAKRGHGRIGGGGEGKF